MNLRNLDSWAPELCFGVSDQLMLVPILFATSLTLIGPLLIVHSLNVTLQTGIANKSIFTLIARPALVPSEVVVPPGVLLKAPTQEHLVTNPTGHFVIGLPFVIDRHVNFELEFTLGAAFA